MKKIYFSTILLLFGCTHPATTSELGYSESRQKIRQSENGVVVTGHPLATNAGVEMLSKGGNAVDAAIAAAFTLAVVEPSMSGIGGRTQILIYSPETGFHGIDGTTAAPSDYDYENAPKKTLWVPQHWHPGRCKRINQSII